MPPASRPSPPRGRIKGGIVLDRIAAQPCHNADVTHSVTYLGVPHFAIQELPRHKQREIWNATDALIAKAS
jgi:hypothetical protein